MDSVSALPAKAAEERQRWRVAPWHLVASLTLLALAVRLIGTSSRPLWLDEAFSAWFSGRSWHELWTVVPTYEAHPPFYYSLLKLWRGLFGANAMALRSLSVVLGALTVPVVMAVAFEQERQAPTGRAELRAGVAGFLAACSPLLVVLGDQARPYPLLTFACALAILGLIRLMGEFAEGQSGKWSSWALLAIGTELTLWAHALGVLYAGCMLVALLPAWLKSPVGHTRLGRGLAVASAVALAYLPCLLLIAGRAHDWASNWLHLDTGVLPYELLALYLVPVEMLTVGSAVAALVIFLLMKRAADHACAAPGWTGDRAMLLLCLGPPLLAAIISAAFVPVFLARTLAGTLIPAYLMVGGGLARTQSASERLILTWAICITLLPTAFQTALRAPPERWDEAASYLSHNVSAADQVWLYPSDSALPLGAVGTRIAGTMRALPAPFPTLGVEGPIRAGWPAMVSLTHEKAEAIAADPSLKRVPTVWLVTRQSGIFDPESDLPNALARFRTPGRLQEWGYIRVQPYARR
jgi:mannosyltransferase